MSRRSDVAGGGRAAAETELDFMAGVEFISYQILGRAAGAMWKQSVNASPFKCTLSISSSSEPLLCSDPEQEEKSGHIRTFSVLNHPKTRTTSSHCPKAPFSGLFSCPSTPRPTRLPVLSFSAPHTARDASEEEDKD